MLYGNKRFIKAHQDISIPYYNHSYDRYVRDVFCSKCGKEMGEQVVYPDVTKEFRFQNEKDNYVYCPYCGHEFKKGGIHKYDKR